MARVILLCVVIGLTAVPPGAAVTPILKGAVTTAYTITVTENGKRVRTLQPGTYTLIVNDEANIHDFHLFGPGVNRKTAVPFVGRVTWTIKLARGLYHYQCDPHSHFMNGAFHVV